MFMAWRSGVRGSAESFVVLHWGQFNGFLPGGRPKKDPTTQGCPRPDIQGALTLKPD